MVPLPDLNAVARSDSILQAQASGPTHPSPPIRNIIKGPRLQKWRRRRSIVYGRPPERERKRFIPPPMRKWKREGGGACFFLFLSRLKVMYGYTLSFLAAVTLGLKEEEEDGG